jgi:hypothetical protein
MQKKKDGSVVIEASRKVAGSRPDKVHEFCQFTNASSHTRPWGLLSH